MKPVGAHIDVLVYKRQAREAHGLEAGLANGADERQGPKARRQHVRQVHGEGHRSLAGFGARLHGVVGQTQLMENCRRKSESYWRGVKVLRQSINKGGQVKQKQQHIRDHNYVRLKAMKKTNENAEYNATEKDCSPMKCTRSQR